MYLPYFDCHCDTLRALKDGNTLLSGSQHVTLEAMKPYPRYVQFFAVFNSMGMGQFEDCTEAEGLAHNINGDYRATPALFAEYERLVKLFYRQMELYSDRIMVCRSVADIDRAGELGRVAAVLTVEDSAQLEYTTVEQAYADGVRACTLTWNFKNRVGGSNLTGGGITEFGRDFLERCERVGMLVDLSHASEALFYDVARLARVPFIATHSNARTLGRHRRNLTDEQFQTLCRGGGVAGFNLYADFIRDEGVCSLEDCADHIQYFLALGGAKHIALGGDLDGCERLPAEISGSGDLYKLADKLAERGVPVSVIEDIFYNNIYRVCKEVWK